jgi:hypothetical protein
LPIVGGTILILASVGMAYSSWNWLILNLQTPTPLSHDQLASLGDVHKLKNPWVSIASPPITNTGVEIRERTSADDPPESKIVLIPVKDRDKDRYLIASVRPEFEGKLLVVGELGVWSNDFRREAERKKNALNKVIEKYPQFEERWLPFQFDATFVAEPRATYVAYGLLLALAAGLGCLVRGVWVTVRHWS